MTARKSKVVAAGWLLASLGTLYVRVTDLLFLPSWDQSVRDHLEKYPTEVVVIAAAIAVAVVGGMACFGSEPAVRGLRWWSWVALVCAFALAVAFTVIGFTGPEFPWFGVLVFVGTGLAAVASLAILPKGAQTPV